MVIVKFKGDPVDHVTVHSERKRRCSTPLISVARFCSECCMSKAFSHSLRFHLNCVYKVIYIKIRRNSITTNFEILKISEMHSFVLVYIYISIL